MNEQELERLLKETLMQGAQAHLARISELEYRILGELPPCPVPSVRPLWQRVVVSGSTLMFSLLSGIWIGAHFINRAPCQDPRVLCLIYPEASNVSLVGQFTLWEPLPMHGPDHSGVWWIRLPETVAPGRYEYGFLVNGLRWVIDPQATEFVRTFENNVNSVLYVHPQGKQPREAP
uniref:Glycoside hydrolase family 13 N-terminal domain-containing protein n=1 Tax=Acetithermum autotrophicum TaxID=1446466 RepID=H5SRN0_ACEAU|nr:hypothetical protein HGMM_OP2C295 [Candidatus Acetothermum autotrophicum]